MNVLQKTDAEYRQKLEAKTDSLRALLAPFSAPVLQVQASPRSHYRMRAEFAIWRENNTLYYAMQDDNRQRVLLEAFPIACQRINILMEKLLPLLREDATLNHKLFQVEFLAATTDDALVTLIYHRPLDEAWQARAQTLELQLGCAVIGRSRGKKIVISRDHIEETFCVNGEAFRYQQIEQSFSQPNASVNQAMLQWAVDSCSGIANRQQRDFLELYCGNGNFTLPLSRLFRRVLATEISKTSVQAAQHNIANNQCDNIAMARLSSEELTQALQKVRPFRRLAHLTLDDYDFCTVLVDPPRAGLDPATLALVSRFDQILYISCNPHTLADNLATLCETHQITRAALFDQFPWTHHMEAGVMLQRKSLA